MKIDGQLPNIEPFNEGAGQTGQTQISGNQTPGADAIEKFQNAEFGDGSVSVADQQKQQQLAEINQQQRELAQQEGLEQANVQAEQAAQQQDDSWFKATDLIPFGIGNWFDGEGSFASD